MNDNEPSLQGVVNLQSEEPKLRFVSPFILTRRGFVVRDEHLPNRDDDDDEKNVDSEPTDGLVTTEFPAANRKRKRKPAKVKSPQLRGLCQLLQCLFYPDWSFREVMIIHKRRRALRAERGLDPAAYVRASMKDAPPQIKALARQADARVRVQNRTTREGGRLLDAQVNAIVMRDLDFFNSNQSHRYVYLDSQIDDYVTILSDWWWPGPDDDNEDDTHPSELQIEENKNSILQVLPVIHPTVWNLVCYMWNKGLRPLAAQVPVGCLRSRLATCIDHIWQRADTDQLVLVELKKWRDTLTLDLSNGHMHWPFDKLKNSARNQHQIQLSVSLFLLQSTFGVQVHEAWVVHVSGDQVSRTVLSKDAWRSTQAAIRLIKNTL